MPLCSVTGTITRGDGAPSVGQQVIATIRLTLDDKGGQVAAAVGVTSEAIEAYTDIEGEFEIDLIQGAIFLLEIPAINLRKEILVPDAVTIDFVSLI